MRIIKNTMSKEDVFELIFHFCAKTRMTAEDAGHLIFALADLMYHDYPSKDKQVAFVAAEKGRLRKRAA